MASASACNTELPEHCSECDVKRAVRGVKPSEWRSRRVQVKLDDCFICFGFSLQSSFRTITSTDPQSSYSL